MRQTQIVKYIMKLMKYTKLQKMIKNKLKM